MSVTMKAIEEFFLDYAEALSARDVPAIVQHWGAPGLVLADQGAIGVGSLEEVQAFFAGSMQQYAQVATARPNLAVAMPLGETMAACRVHWDHLDAAGTRIGGEQGYYMLKDDGQGLRIHAYVPLTA